MMANCVYHDKFVIKGHGMKNNLYHSSRIFCVQRAFHRKSISDTLFIGQEKSTNLIMVVLHI